MYRHCEDQCKVSLQYLVTSLLLVLSSSKKTNETIEQFVLEKTLYLWYYNLDSVVRTTGKLKNFHRIIRWKNFNKYFFCRMLNRMEQIRIVQFQSWIIQNFLYNPTTFHFNFKTSYVSYTFSSRVLFGWLNRGLDTGEKKKKNETIKPQPCVITCR